MSQDKEESYVAGALNFYDSKKLYGRYWGCFEDFDSLHFETCYYQGIEFCIENDLSSFDSFFRSCEVNILSLILLSF